MMNRLLLCGLLALCFSMLHAQTTSDCNMTWSNPATALLNNEGTISYRIQFSKCTSSGICGWPKVSMMHTFPYAVKISLTLRGVGCSGNVLTSGFNTSGNAIAANTDYIDQGNWHLFREVSAVVRVEVSYLLDGNRYIILVDKDRSINRTTINGMSVAEFNARQQQKQSTANTTTSSGSTTKTTTITTPAKRTTGSSTYYEGPEKPLTSAASSGSSYSTNSTGNSTTQPIYNNLNRDLQNTQKTYSAVAGGLQELGNMLQENADKKAAARNAEIELRKQEETTKKQEAERKAQDEALKQVQDEAARKQRAAAAQAERDRQWNMDKQILGNYLVRKKTTDLPAQTKQAFYISYERNYVTGTVKLNTYTLNKYSDDTWMLQNDMLNKIGFKPYFGDNGIGEFLGPFETKQTALSAISYIKKNAQSVTVNDNFLSITGNNVAAGADKNFWNN